MTKEASGAPKAKAKKRKGGRGAIPKVEARRAIAAPPAPAPEPELKKKSTKRCELCEKHYTRTPRARFCAKCLELRREMQLKEGMQNYYKRLRKGFESKKRLVYGGKPTVYAAADKSTLKAAQAQIAEVAV